MRNSNSLGASAVSGLASLGRFRRAAMKRIGNLEIGAAIVLASVLAILAIFGKLLQTHDPMQVDLFARFTPVGSQGFLLGSDNLGRDLWSRMLAGLRWSMSCALTANLINLAIGSALGVIAAERPGWPRSIARQVTDALQCFPSLVVAIVVVVVVGNGFWPVVLTLGFLAWPIYQRVVYAEASVIFQLDYVKAARLAGVGRWRIMLQHVLPALRPSLMVVLAFHTAGLLIAESALSFLGIGAPLGEPTWGNIMAEGRQHMLRAPWIMLVPASAIVVCVVTLNLVGDGLAARSRMRGRSIDV